MKSRLTVLAAVLLLSGCMGTAPDTGPVKGKPIDPAAQAQANLAAELDGLRSQIQRLSAENEELKAKMRSLGGEGSSLADLSRRVQKLEGNLRQMGSQLGVEVDGQQPAAQTQDGQNPFQAQQPAAQAAKQPEPAASSDPAEALYNKGMQAYQAKEYDKAAGLWRDVAKSYPKHALASNAYFWLGEAYFQKGDWGQAVLNYNEVADKFPKSNKAPSAMLKMGMAFQKLNKKEAARLMFQDLIKKHPDSAEARRAKSLL